VVSGVPVITILIALSRIDPSLYPEIVPVPIPSQFSVQSGQEMSTFELAYVVVELG